MIKLVKILLSLAVFSAAHPAKHVKPMGKKYKAKPSSGLWILALLPMMAVSVGIGWCGRGMMARPSQGLNPLKAATGDALQTTTKTMDPIEEEEAQKQQTSLKEEAAELAHFKSELKNLK